MTIDTGNTMRFIDFLQQDGDQFARYLEYKARQDGISREEAASRSLGRLFGQVSGSPNTLLIITAFRGENTLAINRSRNAQLSGDLRGFGWGFTPVLGGFVETIPGQAGQPQQQRVHEESFFVNASGNPQEVATKVISLLKKYQQEAALVKYPGEEVASLLYPNGQASVVGRWQGDPKLMAAYYTRMRKGPGTRQFTFEAAGDDSISTRMAVEAYFRSKT
jgi:hypothetical protein